jgi:hypothetical protein
MPPTQVTVYGKRVLVVMPWQKQVCPLTAFSVAQLVDLPPDRVRDVLVARRHRGAVVTQRVERPSEFWE